MDFIRSVRTVRWQMNARIIKTINRREEWATQRTLQYEKTNLTLHAFHQIREFVYGEKTLKRIWYGNYHRCWNLLAISRVNQREDEIARLEKEAEKLQQE